MRIKQYLLLTVMAVSLLNGQLLLAQSSRSSLGGFNDLDDDNQNERTFNPHGNDSTKKHKEIPKGIYAWTVDRKFGDIVRTEVDTMPHLYPQKTLAMGPNMQFNTTGSNYTARQNRIFIDRKEKQQFAFTEVYDMVLKQPDEMHFTNTLSPITNLSYDNCGNKTNGEDHLDARFAVNAGKRVGIGMDLDYSYARGYYQNQSISHFGATFYGSYLGDKYQLHAIYSTHHQKAAENGGVTNDDYITHPERTEQSYSENEIPVILERNWNRNDHEHLFLTHRYSLGFYQQVPMTEEEKAAKRFALASALDNKKDSIDSPVDTTAVDSAQLFMKREFKPVTSFIHTAEIGSYDRRYQAYDSPTNYYANTYYNSYDGGYGTDSILDVTNYFSLKNTLAIALMEGFNKYAMAGVKVFASHELRRAKMPMYITTSDAILGTINEHNISIGGQLQRTQGHTLHYDLLAETWVAGEDIGQLKLDGKADLNFAFLGDTVRLIAKGYFHRLNPTLYERKFHAKHFWWDNDLSKETRTRIEGNFIYEKTNTTLRVAVEEIQNYTYYGMSYTRANETNTQLTAGVRQHSGNLNVLTAQLDQKLQLGPLHWDNILTYQSSSNKDVLPLPTLNAFSNLYLQFMVAGVLRVELGGAATWFSKYYAPDFCPGINQFAVQENAQTRTELGNFPFIDVYANLHLKHARFFLMMQNATATSFNRKYFLAPHYAQNDAVVHFGVSWNFFN